METQSLIIILFVFGVLLASVFFFGWQFFKINEKRKEEKQDHQFEKISIKFENLEKKLELLTERERETLILVGQGLSSKQIGDKLNIAESTVKTHRKNAYEKLEVNKATELTPFFNVLILNRK